MQNQIDLDNCSQEPIHIPNAIQPHGYLIVMEADSLRICHVSENIMELLESPLAEIIGTNLEKWVSPESSGTLLEALKCDDLLQVNPLPISVVRRKNNTVSFDGILHRSGRFVVMEWEPTQRNIELGSAMSFFSFFHSVRQGTLELQKTETYGDLFRTASEQIKRITGFDRVLIYQFEPDWTGVTVAEVREAHMDSYLGLRFPSSDIPAQARRLYEKKWLRLIADVNYQPVSLVPESAVPIDLSQSTLRSVSPVHLEYMRNMKTQASMSVSIIKQGKLWGLISCHHASPRFVDYQTRIACEFVGQILSQQIDAIEAKEDYAYRQKLKLQGETLFHAISQYGLTESFASTRPPLAELAAADGAAVVTPDTLLRFGQCPEPKAIHALVAWLNTRRDERYFSSFELAKDFRGELPLSCTGLLAVPVSSNRDTYLLWFRRELIQNVSWAGKPGKIEETNGSGLQPRLHPRKSFDSWQEIKRGQAATWRPAEIDAALDLRNNILAEELGRLNAELALSNQELDAFASIAAHDLKEPIRGIKNYATFIIEDERHALSPQSLERLHTIRGLSERTDALLTSLYHYSRVGRVKLSMLPTDLNQVLADVLMRLKPMLDEKRGHIFLPHRLPRLVCDSVRSGEVFYNLIINALKYNIEEEKVIEIGMNRNERSEDVFYVRDNGIGIPKEQLNSIFRIFKRLHAHDEFGGGTGSGLAIAKKIIERHSGRIWADSDGKGSTFSFTFGVDASAQDERIDDSKIEQSL